MPDLKLEVGKIYRNTDGETVCIKKCFLVGASQSQDSLIIFAGEQDPPAPGSINQYYTENGYGVSGFVRDHGLAPAPANLAMMASEDNNEVWLTVDEAIDRLTQAGSRIVSRTGSIMYTDPTDVAMLHTLEIHRQGVIAQNVDQAVIRLTESKNNV